MKHEITSYNTRRLLADALKSAMATKPFSKITVSEIIRRTGVNRKTFYYHFEDIYALMKWMFEEEAVQVVKNFDLLVDYEQAIGFVMDYAETNDALIRSVCDSVGREELKGFFYADFVSVIESALVTAEQRRGINMDPEFRAYVAGFYSEALAGMLLDWVRNKKTRDREKTVRYLKTILESGLSALVS